VKTTIAPRAFALFRSALPALLLGAAVCAWGQLVDNSLTRELKRIFPELAQGYVDLNRNGKLDQDTDLDERVPESAVKDAALQGQEILNFVLKSFKYVPTDKLLEVQKALAGMQGAIPELVALSYRLRIDQAVRERRELDAEGLYLSPSARREALQRIGVYIATMSAAYKKEAQDQEPEFRKARDEFFAMIEQGYPVPASLEDRDREVLTLVLINDLLKTTSDQRARACVRALGLIRSTDGAPYIVQRLTVPALRRESIRALGQIGSKEALPRLLEEFEQERDLAVRRDIIKSLGQIGGDAALVRLKALSGDAALSEAVLEALATVSEKGGRDTQVQNMFLEQVTAEQPRMRILAIRGLTFSGNRAAGNRIVELLATEKDDSVRRELVLGLDRLQHQGTGNALTALLRNPATSADLRLVALETLGRSKEGAQALPQIAAELASPSPAVSAAAADAMVKLYASNAEQVVGTLSRALGARNADKQTQVLGTEVLSRLADPGSLATLTALLASPHPEVKKSAAWGLYRIGSAENPRAVEVLNKLVNDESETMAVRINAVRALGAIKKFDPRVDVVDTMLKVVRMRGDRYTMLRYFALEALANIGESSPRVLQNVASVAARERETMLRRQAIVALKRLSSSDPGVEDALVRLFRGNEDGESRTLAIEALGDVGSSRTAPLAAEMIAARGGDTKRILYALAQVGGRPEIEAILDAARDPALADYVELVLEDLRRDALVAVIDDRLRSETSASVLKVMQSLRSSLAERL
jgi:HEAT repeat protein